MKNAGNLNEKCRILKFKFKYLNEKSIKRQIKILQFTFKNAGFST